MEYFCNARITSSSLIYNYDLRLGVLRFNPVGGFVVYFVPNTPYSLFAVHAVYTRRCAIIYLLRIRRARFWR